MNFPKQKYDEHSDESVVLVSIFAFCIQIKNKQNFWFRVEDFLCKLILLGQEKENNVVLVTREFRKFYYNLQFTVSKFRQKANAPKTFSLFGPFCL